MFSCIIDLHVVMQKHYLFDLLAGQTAPTVRDKLTCLRKYALTWNRCGYYTQTCHCQTVQSRIKQFALVPPADGIFRTRQQGLLEVLCHLNYDGRPWIVLHLWHRIQVELVPKRPLPRESRCTFRRRFAWCAGRLVDADWCARCDGCWKINTLVYSNNIYGNH